MDMEVRLRKLEAQYRSALSGTIAAKAHYLAIASEPSATSYAIERAKSRWQSLEARKQGIAARMGELEALDDVAV